MSEAEVSRRDRLAESAFLAVIGVWAAYVLVEAAGYEDLLAWAFPVIVGVPLLGLCLLKIAYNLTVNDILGRVMFLDLTTGEKAGTRRDAVVFAGTIAVYLLVVELVNFFVAMPVFLFAFFTGLSIYSPFWRVLVTLGIWLFISFVFGSVFGVSDVFLGPFTDFDIGLFG